MSDEVRVPAGLKTRGKRLWKLLHEELEFDAHEATILGMPVGSLTCQMSSLLRFVSTGRW